MKQFLFLLVGAAIYAFLIITHNVIPDRNAGEPDHLAGQRLSAWGPYLPWPVFKSTTATSHLTTTRSIVSSKKCCL